MTDPIVSEMQVAEGCYMVGKRNPESLLQCNTYLRMFRHQGNSELNWCVDPGSQIDYPVVRENLLRHIGSLAELDFFSINHQDPDVVGNLAYLTEENNSLIGLATEDTWRLVRHLNSKPMQVHFLSPLRSQEVKLPGGNSIRAVPTPFCHFRGAMAYYDPESAVLFTGDLFGGLNEPGRVQLVGEEQDWPGIAVFHQIYMPSREAVRYAVGQIRGLDPPVKMIAPQHGFVLTGDFMHICLERLESLPVGMDRLPDELDEKYLPQYQEVLAEVLELAEERLSHAEVVERLFGVGEDHGLVGCLKLDGNQVGLIAKGIRTLPLVVDLLSEEEPVAFRNILRSTVLTKCMESEVPLPPITPGIEGSVGEEWIG